MFFSIVSAYYFVLVTNNMACESSLCQVLVPIIKYLLHYTTDSVCRYLIGKSKKWKNTFLTVLQELYFLYFFLLFLYMLYLLR